MAMQRNDLIQEAHRRFVDRVAASGTVWGLHNDDGWAASDSNHDPDRRVIAFWSDRAYAKRCAKGEWSVYEPTAIPLDKFLEVWLPGMDKDGCFAGTNWDANLCGAEVYPLALKQQIEEAMGKSRG